MKLMHERCTDWGPRRKQREHEIDIEKTRVKRIKRSQQGYGIVWCFGTVATGGLLPSYTCRTMGRKWCQNPDSVALERAT